jgi:ABC-type Fe3+-hydroxamate transport system substrate-binding protein
VKRVVSLVPSWTETLIEAGADVVGRTRFCIHPQDRIRSIEAIGGTKSFNEEKLRSLAPDLIVLDREENTREMFDVASRIAPVLATHVENVHDVSRELRNLATALVSGLSSELGVAKACDAGAKVSGAYETSAGDGEVAARLRAMADRFDAILARPVPALHNSSSGVVRQIKGKTSSQIEFIYLIWQDPWMCVNANTFAASMLAQVGFTKLWAPDASTKYPTIEHLPEDKMLFLATEPYPFAKKRPDLPNANIALVDGESFSWFGIRALRFLEAVKAR